MVRALILKLKESLLSVLPVTIIALLVALTPLVDFSAKEILVFGFCSLALVVGIALFNLGADMSMIPMGRHVGNGIAKSGLLSLLLCASFAMGLFITVAEPDLFVLAGQVATVMDSTLLIITVGVGVGLFLMLAVIKVVYKKELTQLLLFFYMALFALAALITEQSKEVFLPLSFDAGGVTTGPITVPFIMALGVGVANVIGGRDKEENSFGLIALCSIGPMLAVAALSLTASGELSYELGDYSMQSSAAVKILLSTSAEVLRALGFVVILFLILQVFFLKLPWKSLGSLGVGLAYTFFGLVIFLSAASIGFLPFGYKMGTQLALLDEKIVIAFAFIIGAVVVLAEPAVHVLNKQVEDVTKGNISKRSMLIALCIGVGISIGLSVIRILNGFSVLYYLIPGYLLSLGLSFFVPKLYTAIAFDSGGVASGPLTSSFILPMAIGICATYAGEGSILELAFGIVAMVAMTPLITIQMLGFKAIITKKVRKAIAMKQILDADDEQIIDFVWKEAR